MAAQAIFIRHPKRTEPIVWIIDNEQWPRACLRAELIERGYDSRGFVTLADAFRLFGRGGLARPKALILELRNQDVTREAIEAIHEIGVPTIVLGGQKELMDPLIAQSRFGIVLNRPVSLGQIADLIQKIVPQNPAAINAAGSLHPKQE